MRPQLLVFDVDGTLLTSAGQLADSTREVLVRARHLGVAVMISSGRPIAGLRHYLDELEVPVDGLVLSGFNGARVEDGATGQVLAESVLPQEVTARIHRGLEPLPVTCLVPVGDVVYVRDAGGYMVHVEADANGTTQVEVDDLLAAAPTPPKILVAARPEVLRAQRAAIDAISPDDVETCFSAPFYYEINARGVSKGAALAAYCRNVGVDLARTVAFGDNENDLTMVRTAGTGVAMGNAIPALKQVADVVTTSNDEDGIARVLQPLLA